MLGGTSPVQVLVLGMQYNHWATHRTMKPLNRTL